jgi:hypothetical protein
MMAGAMKRIPDEFTDTRRVPTLGNYWRFMKLSKADWADLFADIYRQCYGDNTTADDIIADAERRNVILKRYRATK